MRKLLLFDIDGTLIHTGGAGIRALNQALLEIYGVENGCGTVRMDGKTDRAITREILLTLTPEAPEVPSCIDQILQRYIDHLPAAVQNSAHYRILPGIASLIETLAAKSSDFVLALATGNIYAGARIKLQRANLDHHFLFGGFGCDSETRTEIVKAAIERGFSNCKEEFLPENIYVIGDTEHDIHAGKMLGVKTVAVATGSYSRQDLAKYAPNFLFENFLDQKNFFSIF